MPYKISGTLSDAARVIIIKESDWSVESNTEESSGSYEIDGLVLGYKLVTARKSDGESVTYGSVIPVASVGNVGVFGGGITTVPVKTIKYITISTTSNSTSFGDLTIEKSTAEATSNGYMDRGVFGGGYTSSYVTTIEYVTILTPGNTLNFGNLTLARGYSGATSNGSNNRAVWGGGLNLNAPLQKNVIDYVTISTTGDANDFGDLTVARDSIGACSNGSNNRGIFGGGCCTYYDTIDYITISSLSDATDFGNLLIAKRETSGTSNGTNDRGVFGGGRTSATTYINVIEYVTISTTGNANDFGDLTLARRNMSACSNGTNNRGVFGGGYTGSSSNMIDYITISSTGNALGFGNLAVATRAMGATSNA